MPEVRYIGLGALLGKGLDAVEHAVEWSAEDLVAHQMAAAPVDTGTLRASIHIDSIERSGDGVTAITATGGESSAYAIFVHEGTAPHVIEPKAAQALAWPGGAHPVKVVHHPGTHPDKYMTDPLLSNLSVYNAAMARAAAGVF